MPQGMQQKLIEMVASLSEQQQGAVEAFIHYLQDRDQKSKIDVRVALDEFVREHSELLRRLAQ